MAQMEHDFIEQAARLNTQKNYIAWGSVATSSSSRWMNTVELNVRDYRSIIDNRWSHVSRDLKV